MRAIVMEGRYAVDVDSEWDLRQAEYYLSQASDLQS